ncbi:hypothetical protein C7S13_5097 [Burkholderia cepacia]|nr:hypothetical protein [Burkholderia cepacia]
MGRRASRFAQNGCTRNLDDRRRRAGRSIHRSRRGTTTRRHSRKRASDPAQSRGAIHDPGRTPRPHRVQGYTRCCVPKNFA